MTRCPTIVILGAILITVGQSMAADWNVDGNGDWNVNGNWVNPATFPNATDSVADFTKINIAADRTITLQAAITNGALILGDNNGDRGYYLQPGAAGSLTFDVSAGSAMMHQAFTSGVNRIYVPTILLDDLVITNADTGSQLMFYAPVSNNGNRVFIQGDVTCGSSAAAFAGSGDIIVQGAGTRVNLRSPTHTYTGALIVTNDAEVLEHNNLGPGALILNGGVLCNYWSTTLTRSLGTNTGQIALLGGTSGLCGQGSAGFTFRFNNNSSYELVWGSEFFNPDVLVMQSTWANGNGDITIDNPIDLNGADRTIICKKVHSDDGGYASLPRAIRNSTNTAGIIKLGPGALRLQGANTYNGNTIISAGMLQFNSAGSIGGSGRSVVVSNGAVVCPAFAADNAFLNRLEENTNTFIVALGANSGNDLDFSSGSGASLPNAFLGCKGSCTYSGTLTPHDNTLRLGGGPYGGTLTVSSGVTGISDLEVGGNVTLSGTVSYRGETTVNSGTLTVNSFSSQDDIFTTTIAASGATMNLNFAGTNDVGALTIGTTEMGLGLYGAGGTSLPQLTGTGTLNVIGLPPGGTVLRIK